MGTYMHILTNNPIQEVEVMQILYPETDWTEVQKDLDFIEALEMHYEMILNPLFEERWKVYQHNSELEDAVDEYEFPEVKEAVRASAAEKLVENRIRLKGLAEKINPILEEVAKTLGVDKEGDLGYMFYKARYDESVEMATLSQIRVFGLGKFPQRIVLDRGLESNDVCSDSNLVMGILWDTLKYIEWDEMEALDAALKISSAGYKLFWG